MKSSLKKILLTGLSAVIFFAGINSTDAAAPYKNRKEMPRTVITNDGEVDDCNSVLRAMLYSNEMDIAGIVITSSMYHYAGDPAKNIAPYRWTGTDWIYKFIDDYGKVHQNLIKHDKNYPTADYFRSVTHIGNIKNVGEMDEITDGSEFLKNLFLDDDDRPLYVQTWGGTNTTARALKSIEDEYKNTPQWKQIQDKLNKKIILYTIARQDKTYDDYIAKNWSGLTVLNDQNSFAHFAYAWLSFPEDIKETFKAKWMKDNILNDSPLMQNYATMEDGKWQDGELDKEQRGVNYISRFPEYEKYDFISEGDSPSFFYILNTGLRTYENPTYGGWSGRFGTFKGRLAVNDVADYNPQSKKFETAYAIKRWIDDIQNDFAARADWCVADSYSKANHAPIAKVAEGNNISAKAEQKITLTAKATDPDGDKLSYKWWRYFEADTYQDDKREKPQLVDVKGKIVDFPTMEFTLNHVRDLLPNEKIDVIKLDGANSQKVSFTVPSDSKVGDTIHIILEVQDNGKHNLKHYQRVIVTVK